MSAFEATPLHAGKGSECAHRGTLYAIRYNAQGDYFFTAGADKLIHLWSHAHNRIIKSYKGHGYEVLGVAVYFFRYFMCLEESTDMMSQVR